MNLTASINVSGVRVSVDVEVSADALRALVGADAGEVTDRQLQSLVSSLGPEMMQWLCGCEQWFQSNLVLAYCEFHSKGGQENE